MTLILESNVQMYYMTSSEITVPVNFDLSNKECTISGAVRTYLSCTGTRNKLRLVLD
jgi:hypothetical protein